MNLSSFFSSLDPDELITLSPLLLQTVLDTIPTGIQVLKSIRNENKEIIDFEYILYNETARSYTEADKKLMAGNLKKTDVFKHLVDGANAEPGNKSPQSFSFNGATNLFHIKYVKFGDGVLLSIEDITGKKMLEDMVERLNENILSANHDLAKAKLEMQTFSSIAANDYKDTLKLLYTTLEFITSAEAQNLSNAGRANIRRAQAAIQKLKLLTEDIIIYSTIQRLEGIKTIVNLKELLETIKTFMVKKIKGEGIEIDCNDTILVQGNPDLLSLLFHHLLDNAIKFTQQGKKTIVQVNCTQQEAAAINIRAAIPGKKYEVISIIDNGNGFEPEYAEDIFKMFYRVPNTHNQKGSGMGLAICKKIMDIHGGFITAESVPGEGATFNCYFPI